MELIMLKLSLYIIFAFLSAFAISGINFNGIIGKNKNIEARVLVILLSLALSYLITNFVLEFLSF